MSLVIPGVRAALTPQWVRHPLWQIARQVPAFHLDFTTGQAIERIGGRLGTFTRPSSVKNVWNGSQFVQVAADVPALQRDPATGLWGYLHEPAATNQHLNNATLNLSNCTGASGGSGVVPGQDKTIVTGNAGSWSKRINAVGSAGAATGTYCYWAIIESSSTEPNIFMVLTDNAGNTFRQRFFTANGGVNGGSVSNGTVTGGTAIVQPLTSSVFLVGVFATFTSPLQVLGQMWLDQFGSSTTTGTVVVHHCQLETGPIATSPIITTGSAVTRAVDTWAWTGAQFSDWYQQAGGVIVARASMNRLSGFQALASISDGSNANRVQISSNSNAKRVTSVVANSDTFVQNGGVLGNFTLGAQSAIAYRFENAKYAVAADGGAIASQLSGALFSGATTLRVGADGGGGSLAPTLLHQFAYFPPGPAADRIQALSAL